VVLNQISSALAESPDAVLSLTRLKSMDHYTFLHSVSVAALLMRLYRHLKRDEAEVREIGMAGLLHDVGKLTVKRAILTKTAPLTEAECTVIRSHPERGRDILARSADIPQTVLDVCLLHHERIDGSGYPMGLAGEAIGFHARSAAICDVFDALTSVRPYKQAWSAETALMTMRRWAGAFDPDLLGAFADCLGFGFGELGAEPAKPMAFSINGYSDPSAA
jgi:HD-GYP domain-containing protein (c-di-GMP phosphodiesterase class II)